MSKKQRDELEELATKLTGIAPIKDYEYQRCEYSRPQPGVARQRRTKLFKSVKRIL